MTTLISNDDAPCRFSECQQCGQPITHNGERHGIRVAASKWSGYLNQTYPNEFWVTDIDAVIAKAETRIVRVTEHKEPGQALKASQKHVLPKIAFGIESLVMLGVLAPSSGVFVVYSTSTDFEFGHVSRVRPNGTESQAVLLSGDAWAAFCQGGLVELPD